MSPARSDDRTPPLLPGFACPPSSGRYHRDPRCVANNQYKPRPRAGRWQGAYAPHAKPRPRPPAKAPILASSQPLKRAESTRTYLKGIGITNGIMLESRGESEPLRPNDTPENKQKNRRINLIIE